MSVSLHVVLLCMFETMPVLLPTVTLDILIFQHLAILAGAS